MKTFTVAIKFVAVFPMRSIALALRGSEREDGQSALRVLDIILKQRQAERFCIPMQILLHTSVRATNLR